MPLFGPPNIEKLKERRNVKGLIKALDESTDFSLRLKAVKALGEIGDSSAAAPLAAMVRDRNISSVLRKEAIRALKQTGGQPAVEALIFALEDDLYDIRQAAAWALGDLRAAEAVESLVAGLRDPNKDAAGAARLALTRIKAESTVGAIQRFLQETEAVEPRCQAIGILASFSSKEAVDLLIESLEDQDASIRAEAAQALGKNGGSRAIDPLAESLSDENDEVRQCALTSILAINDPSGFDLVTQLFEHEDSALRMQASKALGELGDTRSVAPLIAKLNDANGDVVTSAKIALKEIVNNNSPLKQDAIAADIVAALDGFLEDPTPRMRRHVADAIGGLGRVKRFNVTDKAVDSLIKALKDEDELVRVTAVTHLGDLGDRRASEPLKALESDSSELVSKAATAACVKILQSDFMDMMNFGR